MNIRDEAFEIGRQGYSDAIADAEARDEAPSIEAGRAGAFTAVMDAFTTGKLTRDRLVEAFAHEVATGTHERITNQGKRLLKQFQQGQLALGDLLDAVIIPIGDGQIVRHLRTLDALALQQMLETADENIRDALASRDLLYRTIYRPWFPILIQHGISVGEAYDQGFIA